jgi:putative membrane protein
MVIMKSSETSGRWPGWVYGGGAEPDPRFSLANERTFLAWIRTGLALLAAGVGLDTLPLPIGARPQRMIAVELIALGLACTASAWWRWARTERAIRRGEPLPAASAFGATLATGVFLAGSVYLLVSL